MGYYGYSDEEPGYYARSAWHRLEGRDELFLDEQVIGRFGGKVGTVKDILDYGFRVSRPFSADAWLPFGAIEDVSDNRIRLSIPEWEVGTAATATYGPYSGVGPRGYRRSDERIREDTNDRLWASGRLDANGIDVSVEGGVVSLNGLTDSRWAKRKAEDLAWTVPGVVDVINNLHLAGGTWDNWRSHMVPGMDVVGSQGSKLGSIGEIRDYRFLTSRQGEAGLWVPFTAIQDVRNGRVILNVTRDEIKNLGWATTNTQPA